MVAELQNFLNWFLKGTIPPLVEDGIAGNMTNAALAQAIVKLKDLFQVRNWRWNDTFNFIGFRVDEDFDDRFEDYFVLYCYGTLIAMPASTVSGMQGVANGVNLWVNGKNGVGIMAENQQVNYLLVEPNDNTFFNPQWTGGIGFLYQETPIYLYRDNNGNNIIDKSVKVYETVGINLHSWINFDINIVSNLSTGCQVTMYRYWKVLFPILVKHAVNKRIIYSLIKM